MTSMRSEDGSAWVEVRWSGGERGRPCASPRPTVLHYTVANAPVDLAYTGVTGWTSDNGSPLVTPSQADWDSWVNDSKKTGPVPAVAPGVYLAVATFVSGNGDQAGRLLRVYTSTGTVSGQFVEPIDVQTRHATGPAWIVAQDDGFLVFEVDYDVNLEGRDITLELQLFKVADAPA